jgi:NAD(P)-dependent dehydrogenase (short-subunit alcohol dehydrogenase family)
MAVVIADIDEAAGERLAAQLGPPARFVRVDVRNDSDLRRAAGLAAAAQGGLRVTVTCAGAAASLPTIDDVGDPFPIDICRRIMDVNFLGTFNAMTMSAMLMSRNEPDADGQRGVIVLVASASAFDGQPGQIAYAASKGAVASMTLPAARDLARHGIRVCSIAPGSFDTPLLSQFYTTEALELTARNIPFPSRLGRPSEFASLVQCIISNTMLNGATIRIDGAQRLGAIRGGLASLLEADASGGSPPD